MSGLVVWFTGRPAAGKTTLARAVMAQAQNHATCLLDSDEIRAVVFPELGYSESDRTTFYKRLADLALLFAKQGLVVLVAATAHRRRYRDYARAIAPNFLEIFVDTAPEICAQRDPKGLYRTAGDALPGAGIHYEEPTAPDLVAHGGVSDSSVAQITTLINRARSNAA